MFSQLLYFSDFKTGSIFSELFKYFSNWGVILTLITMVLALRVPFREDSNAQQQSSNSSKSGRWKSYLIFFQMSLVFEVVITVVYWAFMSRPKHNFGTKICIHIVPIISLTIEFCLMATPFSMRHLLPTFIVGILYLIINFTFSKLSQPVYKILTWDDYHTVLRLGVGIMLIVVIHIILTFLSKRKTKYFKDE